jgi:hypothetical protein
MKGDVVMRPALATALLAALAATLPAAAAPANAPAHAPANAPASAPAAIPANAPAAADESGCPFHAAHMAEQAAGVEQRGDHTMGFDHAATTHHFLLTAEGGAIEVEANDPADTASRDAIRRHLTQIAGAFQQGDFASPRAIHDRVLPGVPEMTRRKEAIAYRFEETERGGRVRIATSDPAALAAVHDFLRAQIADHQTGDPLPAAGH